ncbi:exopolyphosphatase [Candidatus Neomarinimicrobiota bacterium]
MRVVYRGDFDGSVCAAMLIELDKCDDLVQYHPQDVQNQSVEITDKDIICNLPYHPKCHMWFDHHSSEIGQIDFMAIFAGTARIAPSAARLVFEYFEKDFAVIGKYQQLVADADLVDGGYITAHQLMEPKGSTLLALLLDPRTGLGLNHDFAISNFQWSIQIPELLTKHSVDEILAMPDTEERIIRYREMEDQAKQFYSENSYLDGNVIVSDIRGKTAPVANRFLIYGLPGFTDGNISVRISDGKDKKFYTINVAHSIVTRTSDVDAGMLCKKYKGGGHERAAACQVSIEDSDRILKEIIAACKQ